MSGCMGVPVRWDDSLAGRSRAAKTPVERSENSLVRREAIVGVSEIAVSRPVMRTAGGGAAVDAPQSRWSRVSGSRT